MAVGVPVNFDGTNDSLSLSAVFTGIADGQIGLISVWLRDLGAAGAGRRVFSIHSSTNVRFVLSRSATNLWNLTGRTAANALILDVTSGSPAPGADTNWHHILISFNLANAAERAFYIDGVDASPTWNTYTNGTIDFTPSPTPLAMVGTSTAAGATRWNGDMAELYFHTPATWFDVTNPTNLAKFISAGAPVDLSSTDGSLPLGVEPFVCLNAGTVAAWPTNVGSGGGFTLTGTLANGAALPVAAAAGMVPPPPSRRFQHMLVR